MSVGVLLILRGENQFHRKNKQDFEFSRSKYYYRSPTQAKEGLVEMEVMFNHHLSQVAHRHTSLLIEGIKIALLLVVQSADIF